MKAKDLFKITSIPILIASLCCLSPVVLVLLGVSYKWLFILCGTIVLVISLFIYFRGKGICTFDQAKRQRNEVLNTVLIAITTTVIGYILFFHIFLQAIGKLLTIWK